ncbi:MAG TPA: hypothetical protein VJR71_14495 [Pseudolabrys sp.]|nr:hypothetical protein [Pseudolabrys sp.]
MRNIVVALLCAGVLCGCVTTETVQFQPRTDQQSITRDGVPGIVSTKKGSIVIARPAVRQFQIGGRPVFVLAIYNRSRTPQEFRVSNVNVTQHVNGNDAAVKVITYDELVSEEKTRQTLAAIGAGLAVAGNSMAAAQAGYYNANSTVYTPRGGIYQVNTTGYSPTAAAIAQSNANAQNAELVSATIERGQANMVMLERAVIKDDTLMPGEWYGGQLHIAPLVSQDGPKMYTISVTVGSDRHEIQIAQGGAPDS